ncbi:peptidase S8/S53 domain-containing protein [Thelonectria olida]|uniref:Peptidase S8/S53 domain-containing protein n=1 Tax=Thelonectria olida TaxID=1576542 RepID=A0A9P8VRB3_9HYPO|nr:peptidase S8/S53 domain-containing protein [Thelonectria olida]
MAVEFSFFSKEVLAPGAPIRITLPRRVDSVATRKAIHVEAGSHRIAVPIRVDADANATAAELSTHALASDLYRIIVDALVDGAGNAVTSHPASRLVCIRRFPSSIPKHLRVEHAIHLAVGELETQRLKPGEKAPSGTQYLSRVKAVHHDTLVPCCLSYDGQGNDVDGEAILRAVNERRLAKFGHIHETLWHELEAAEESDAFEVTVWPLLQFDPLLVRKEGDGRSVRDAYRTPKEELIGLVTGFGADVADHSLLPSFSTRLTVSQIRVLAKSEHVGKIYPCLQTAGVDRDGDDDGDKVIPKSIGLARGTKALEQGHNGENIKVAVLWERGPTDVTHLELAGRLETDTSGVTRSENEHARAVCGIIKNKQPPGTNVVNGYAPGCTLYLANRVKTDRGKTESLEWVITNQCSVVCVSSHERPEATTSTMSARDVQMDFLSATHPFPTFVTAGGQPRINEDADPPETYDNLPPSTDYVVHKAFNIMTVGAHITYLSTKDPSKNIPQWVNYRNPSSPHHDRELPDIVAPGIKVYYMGSSHTGTSFAAPAVAGTVAILQSTNKDLIIRPEACRAIMLAGAGRNAFGNRWWADLSTQKLPEPQRVDGKDGAGALDALAAVRITQNLKRAPSPPSALGWDRSGLEPADFEGDRKLSKKRWFIQVPALSADPSTPPDDKILKELNLRATLAWISTFEFRGMPRNLANAESSVLSLNLDLILLDEAGKEIASSTSFDNNYEVIDFPALPGHKYSIAIRLVSGTGFTPFAVAWCCFLKGSAM